MSKSVVIKKLRVVKRDLVSHIARELGLKKVQVDAVLTQALAQMTHQLQAGNYITLSGFGSFFLREVGGFERGGRRVRRSRRICFVPSDTTRIVVE